MNVILLRYISKDLLGLVNVRLMLLFNTIYCLSTEPCLRTCLSRDKGSKVIPPSIINTLWLSLPIGLFWSLLCMTVWLVCFEWPGEELTGFYSAAVLCYSLAAFIEILSEPIRIITQILLLVKVKPFVEGFSLAVETLVVVMCVVMCPSYGLQAFCVARLIHSLCVSISYYTYFTYKLHKNKKSRISKVNSPDAKSEFPFNAFHQILPTNPSPTTSLPINSILLWSFSKQVVLKQMITEGEKYMMTIFGLLSFEDQGIYSLVSNLGSMVVRILMLPMEEGFYLFVSRSIPRSARCQDGKKEKEEEERERRREEREEEEENEREREEEGEDERGDGNKVGKKGNMKEEGKDVGGEARSRMGADGKVGREVGGRVGGGVKVRVEGYRGGGLEVVARALESMIKLRFLFGLVLCTFGFSCSFVVLDILFGRRISTHPGPMLLRATSFYLLFVSLNGVLEAFQNASMTPQQVNQHNKFMFLFSASFLFVCLFLTSILPLITPSNLSHLLLSPPVAFIIANCITMLLRIVYSSNHIYHYFHFSPFSPLSAFRLTPSVVAAFVTVFVVTASSEWLFVTSNNNINNSNINSNINTSLHTSDNNIAATTGNNALHFQKLIAYLSHGVVVLFSLLFLLVVVYVKENKLVSFVKENIIKKTKKE